MFVNWLFIFFNSCEILPDCDVTDFQLVIFLTKRKIVLHFDLHKKILDMHIQNASVFERSLLYKYVCETWRLIRLNSKINPHIKKFANPKKPNDSQILSLYIFVTIYIIEVMIHVNYVRVSDVHFEHEWRYISQVEWQDKLRGN